MLPELDPIAKIDSRVMHDVARTATQGLPKGLVVSKIPGAKSMSAIECSVRTAVRRSPIPAEVAETMMQASIKADRTLIPEVWIAMTYGLAEAVVEEPRQGSVYGTMRLTQKAPRK